MDELLIHSCEQVLRFSRAQRWDDLSEERKVQLGYNMGAMAHALKLPKMDSFDSLTAAREGKMTMPEFHQHLRELVAKHQVTIDEAKVGRPF